jgi:DNA modification methylase
MEDWSFAHLKRVETLWGPHGYHRYPAKFIPQLVQRVIEQFSAPGELVGDPFLGSATTGIEALRLGRRFVGSDVSQVALCISQAKCFPLAPTLLADAWQRLNRQLDDVEVIGRRRLYEEEIAAIQAIDIARATHEERLHYWFPAAYRASLTAILELILRQSEEALRPFFLCGFSNILKRCSIWLSGSTKAQKDLAKVLGDPVDEFRKQANSMIERNMLYLQDVQQRGIDPDQLADKGCIYWDDARSLALPDAALDLLVTSPPYAICYEYKEIHQLTQLWFERFGIIEPDYAQTSWIGSKGLAHRHEEAGVQSTGSSIADAALTQLASLVQGATAQGIRQEVRALRYYFQDMRKVLRECRRVIAPGKYFVLIVGNSYRRGVTIPTVEALCEMAGGLGLALERSIARKIPVRVLVSSRDKKTGRFSSTPDTQVYPEEYVLIFKRL